MKQIIYKYLTTIKTSLQFVLLSFNFFFLLILLLILQFQFNKNPIKILT